MAKLDKFNRIYLPSKFRKRCNVDFSKDVYCYVPTQNSFFLDNASHAHRFTTNLGKVYLDQNNKMYLSRKLRNLLKIDKTTELYFFVSVSDVLYIKKYTRTNIYT